jgi:hypothetical protein
MSFYNIDGHHLDKILKRFFNLGCFGSSLAEDLSVDKEWNQDLPRQTLEKVKSSNLGKP